MSDERHETRLVRGRLSVDVYGTRIVRQLTPCVESMIRRDGGTVHRNSIAKQTQDGEAGQQVQTNSAFRLFLPPLPRRFMRCVPANEKREEYVSVRDTRH